MATRLFCIHSHGWCCFKHTAKRLPFGLQRNKCRFSFIENIPEQVYIDTFSLATFPITTNGETILMKAQMNLIHVTFNDYPMFVGHDPGMSMSGAILQKRGVILPCQSWDYLHPPLAELLVASSACRQANQQNSECHFRCPLTIIQSTHFTMQPCRNLQPWPKRARNSSSVMTGMPSSRALRFLPEVDAASLFTRKLVDLDTAPTTFPPADSTYSLNALRFA